MRFNCAYFGQFNKVFLFIIDGITGAVQGIFFLQNFIRVGNIHFLFSQMIVFQLNISIDLVFQDGYISGHCSQKFLDFIIYIVVAAHR